MGPSQSHGRTYAADIDCPKCGAPAKLPCNAAREGGARRIDHPERGRALREWEHMVARLELQVRAGR